MSRPSLNHSYLKIINSLSFLSHDTVLNLSSNLSVILRALETNENLEAFEKCVKPSKSKNKEKKVDLSWKTNPEISPSFLKLKLKLRLKLVPFPLVASSGKLYWKWQLNDKMGNNLGHWQSNSRRWHLCASGSLFFLH